MDNSSEYESSSDYDTTEEEEVKIKDQNNLSNSYLIDYSQIKCASCDVKSKQKENHTFIFFIFIMILIIIGYHFLKR